jgi:hypothetical protein
MIVPEEPSQDVMSYLSGEQHQQESMPQPPKVEIPEEVAAAPRLLGFEAPQTLAARDMMDFHPSGDLEDAEGAKASGANSRDTLTVESTSTDEAGSVANEKLESIQVSPKKREGEEGRFKVTFVDLIHFAFRASLRWRPSNLPSRLPLIFENDNCCFEGL